MVVEQTATFPGRFDSLAVIGKFVTEAAENAGLDSRAIYAVEMAVDEACTNIIEHAYGGEGRGEIECTCRIDDEGLTVVLRDQGRSFNPEGVPDPNLAPEDIQDCQVGGLGLYFMRQLMSEVHFEFTDRGNVLTMTKYREEPAS